MYGCLLTGVGKKAVAQTLSDAGFPVTAHDEVFGQEMPDEEWLKKAGQEGWIALSADRAIRHKANELVSLRKSNLFSHLAIVSKIRFAICDVDFSVQSAGGSSAGLDAKADLIYAHRCLHRFGMLPDDLTDCVSGSAPFPR